MRFDKIYESYMNTAKQVVGKSTTRQQSDRMGATPWRQGSQNLVPDRDRVDPTLNSKIERLKELPNGKEILDDTDIQYMMVKHDIRNLDKHTPKNLGKTGITVYWDENISRYIAEK